MRCRLCREADAGAGQICPACVEIVGTETRDELVELETRLRSGRDLPDSSAYINAWATARARVRASHG